MSAVAGVLAGLVTAAGAVALYRYAERRTRSLCEQFNAHAPTQRRPDVIDFERDPDTGVYRAR